MAGWSSLLSTHRRLIADSRFRISLGTTVGVPFSGQRVDPRHDRRRIGREAHAERPSERTAPDGEVEAVACRVQPAATTRQATTGVGDEGDLPLLRGARHHSQKHRPAIRCTTSDARAGRARSQRRLCTPESSPVGIVHSSGSVSGRARPVPARTSTRVAGATSRLGTTTGGRAISASARTHCATPAGTRGAHARARRPTRRAPPIPG